MAALTRSASPAVVTGPGPGWFRVTLVFVALAYYVLIFFKVLPDGVWTRPVNYFTRAACLFPHAAMFSTEYRLSAWSCAERQWRPLDVSAYFSMHAENKESRFYRLAHFYKRNRTVLYALDDFITSQHPVTRDGITGPIGGIRLTQVSKPVPPPGSSVERYVFTPLAPIPEQDAKDLFYTPSSKRNSRCASQP